MTFLCCRHLNLVMKEIDIQRNGKIFYAHKSEDFNIVKMFPQAKVIYTATPYLSVQPKEENRTE